ncbi:MAG: ABC transporter substrate-binding protein [Arcobacteraceae bacterium]|jgi:phospholipid transport system substrate-binding protein|nr:ABC transporter substrate-binding protein [Arcobacteraceae bacterium]MDY0326844.1 ABC transporter substrate-binding protein [Arcobacteraceae bacterium]
MIRIIFVFALMFNFLFALEENSIENEMKIRIDKITLILKNSELSKSQKSEKLFNILDDVFDFELMAKISLGRIYNTLTPTQQSEFVNRFVIRLKNSYIDKIDLYNGQEVVMKGLEKIKIDRINLFSQIQGQNENYDIVYKFYPKANEWYIYDIDMLGISIVQTYRKQFSEFLATKNIDELLESLK